jgi:DNA primase
VRRSTSSVGTFHGLCPVHQERTPSIWIDPRDDRAEHYFLYGCGATGDAIQFVMDREDCSFLEACERLAERGRPYQTRSAPRPATAPRSLHW